MARWSAGTVPAGGSGFRPDVEGLRAVAVLLVLGDHVLGLPRGGYVGVDVFFVVSGFLITGLLAREADRTGRVDQRAFWVRRVRRLLPAGLTVLALTTLAAQLLFLPVRASQTARDAVAAALFSANVRFAVLGTDYFSATRPPSPVQHYWSLAVEEQFYAVWPLLVLLVAWRARRTGTDWRRSFGRLVRGVLVASLAWSVWATATSPATAYFSTPARAFELAAGALVALSVHRLRRLTGRGAALLSGVGLAVVLAGAVLLVPGVPFPGALALVPVLGTCAVLAGGAGRTGPHGVGSVLARPLPRLLGRLSYALYLVHWPVVVLVAALVPDPPVWTPVAVLVGSLALAAALHVLVEQPLRRPPAPRPARARGPLAAVGRPALPALLLAALAAIGTTAAVAQPEPLQASAAVQPTVVRLPGGGTGQGEPGNAWPDRTAVQAAVQAGLASDAFGELAPSLGALQSAGAPEWVGDGCLDVFPDDEQRCTYGSPRAARSAVLLGDSVAVSLLPGLRAALEPQGYRLHVLTRRQCALGAPDDAVSPGCRAHRDHVLAEVGRLAPDLVVASGSYVAGSRAFTPDDAAAWRSRTADVLRGLAAPGRRVVLVGAPARTGNLQSCATRVGSPQACVRAPDPTWQALVVADRDGARDAGAVWVDPSTWLCRGGRCPAVLDATPVAFDGTHLTAAASRRLALLLRSAVLGGGRAGRG